MKIRLLIEVFSSYSGLGTSIDTCSHFQRIEISEIAWNDPKVYNGLKFRTDLLLDYSYQIRDQQVRRMQCSDLALQHFPDEGVKGAYAMRAVSRKSKTNNFNHNHQNWALRHYDAKLCSLGSVGFLFFYRFHVLLEPPFDFSRRDMWYKEYLLPSATDKNIPISYSTNYTNIKNAQVITGHFTSSVVHGGRKSSAMDQSNQGCSVEDMKRNGGYGLESLQVFHNLLRGLILIMHHH